MGTEFLLIATIMIRASVPCPAGTRERSNKTEEAREQWCETSDGVRHGPRHAWYADGARWFEGEYQNGKRHGGWMFWFPNGKKRTKSNYVADKQHGKAMHWHDNGQKALEGKCEGGAENGAWRSHWPNGKPESKITFRDGRAVSATYWSRRGLPLKLDAWLAEKVRGATPGTTRFERARKRYLVNGIFEECRN